MTNNGKHQIAVRKYWANIDIRKKLKTRKLNSNRNNTQVRSQINYESIPGIDLFTWNAGQL